MRMKIILQVNWVQASIKYSAMITLYRIYDHTTKNTLANSLDEEQAEQVLHFLKLEYPQNELEIESYSHTSVRGLGRDPDLH